MSMLFAVAESPEFSAAAKRAGMTDEEIETAIGIVAADPTGGVPLGGGLYKVRIPRTGTGKSGGYRIITLFVSVNAPVVLLSVLSKARQANFSAWAKKIIVDKAKEIKRPKP